MLLLFCPAGTALILTADQITVRLASPLTRELMAAAEINTDVCRLESSITTTLVLAAMVQI